MCWSLQSWPNADTLVSLSKQSYIAQFCHWSDNFLSCLNLLLMTTSLGPSLCFFHYCTYGFLRLSMSCQNLHVNRIYLKVSQIAVEQSHLSCYFQKDGACSVIILDIRAGSFLGIHISPLSFIACLINYFVRVLKQAIALYYLHSIC